MNNKSVQEKTLPGFLEDVKNHNMKIIHEDGLYRHIEFRNTNGSSNQSFAIMTWPYFLCIHGDMGDYVFTGPKDMFELFYTNDLIDYDSFAGKRFVCGGREGVTEFSRDEIKKFFKSEAIQYAREIENPAKRAEFYREAIEEIEDQLLRSPNLEDAVEDLIYWEYGSDLPFCSYFDVDCMKVPTHHFAWCCNAVVWAVEWYNHQLWKESCCVACGLGSDKCNGDCELYPDWEHDFFNPFFEPRRPVSDYWVSPLENNPYLKRGSE